MTWRSERAVEEVWSVGEGERPVTATVKQQTGRCPRMGLGKGQ